MACIRFINLACVVFLRMKQAAFSVNPSAETIAHRAPAVSLAAARQSNAADVSRQAAWKASPSSAARGAPVATQTRAASRKACPSVSSDAACETKDTRSAARKTRLQERERERERLGR